MKMSDMKAVIKGAQRRVDELESGLRFIKLAVDSVVDDDDRKQALSVIYEKTLKLLTRELDN